MLRLRKKLGRSQKLSPRSHPAAGFWAVRHHLFLPVLQLPVQEWAAAGPRWPFPGSLMGPCPSYADTCVLDRQECVPCRSSATLHGAQCWQKPQWQAYPGRAAARGSPLREAPDPCQRRGCAQAPCGCCPRNAGTPPILAPHLPLTHPGQCHVLSWHHSAAYASSIHLLSCTVHAVCNL